MQHNKPSIPIIRGSTALILTKMYQTLKSQSIPGVEAIPPSNPVLRKCVALDCMTAMEGTKISTQNNLNNILDYMDAHIPRLPQADIKKILAAQHAEAKKKLTDIEATEQGLYKEYQAILLKQEKSIDTILRMVAAQPTSMVGSQPIEQQLQREKDFLTQLRHKIETAQRQEQDLRATVEMTFTTLQKSSGERGSMQRFQEQLSQNQVIPGKH